MTHSQDTPNVEGRRRAFLKKHSILFVYIFMTLIVVLAFTLNGLSQQSAKEARCAAAVDSRNVQRATVEAVFNLAGGSFTRAPDDPPLTERERKQYNEYIDRVNDFRYNMYEQIKPSEECAPYVDDDNVRPSTPPIAPIKRSQ